MPGFKAINSSSQAVAERIAAAGQKLQAEKSANMSGPRERAASTVSAVTLSPEGGSDNEDAPQVPEKTKRKSPSKAKEQARNGGKRWVPDDRWELWLKRRILSRDNAETQHDAIGERIGRTGQACRIELVHMNDRHKEDGLVFALYSSFTFKKNAKNESQEDALEKAKDLARRKAAAASKAGRASSPVPQLRLPEFSPPSAMKDMAAENHTRTPSVESVPSFRSLSGDRVKGSSSPSSLGSATWGSFSAGVQTRAQHRAENERTFHEPELADDNLTSVPSTTHDDAKRVAAGILASLQFGI